MFRKIRFSNLLLALFVLLASSQSQAADEKHEGVTSARADTFRVYAKRADNIRSGPSTAHDVLRKTKKHEPLLCERVDSGWYKLATPDGEPEAWVHESVVLTETEMRQAELARAGNHKPTAELPFGPWVAATISRADIHKGPTSSSKTLAQVPKDTKLDVLEEKVNDTGGTAWAKVTHDGATGWVDGAFLDRVPMPASDVSPAAGASESASGKFVTIATPGKRARLSPVPDSPPLNREILRVPQGTRLRVEAEQRNDNGLFSATWFKVTYKGSTGWISEHDTQQ